MTLRKRTALAIKYQKGSFMIELVFVLTALWGVYLFGADLSHQLFVRAKLDRSSFALVNVIKERTRYFDADVLAGKNLSVTNADLKDLAEVAGRMLDMPPEDVAIRIESLTNKTNLAVFTSSKFKSLNCKTESIRSYAELAPVENAVVFPLYRVSLCEEQTSWFKPFFNGGKSTTVAITSSSIMPGR
ncbi:tight adherence pilus pseudopilin TadF [Vibrio campbellii]|uniref:tight adherence pilus pseudopilin TadF n=1 Tax=Vibrio TaxID=662 RepID=UPI0005EEBDBD|nr:MULTISPECIES: tight adherence pilus pseudopilin TadF [Vibrio]ARR47651.1 membrane associated secretion system protein [Vibrio campbellii]MCC4225885.1 membrane associated secretion system protein [Vibrio campbellii]MDK9772416.1 membrane associated secretion system protein [Vibrio sp. B181a]NIY86176.1 membrane associated secretion system protein [Vibrio campbellii]NVK70603.1 membrane associated secretion system protein [Vibrio campbellii]|tara:strand:- start:536 stop:1096 length:561 start_codon:yes stop_codon:yes gene_type:complete